MYTHARSQTACVSVHMGYLWKKWSFVHETIHFKAEMCFLTGKDTLVLF